MRVRRGGILLVVASLFLSLPPTPVAAYGETGFNQNLDTSGGTYPVNSGATAAQSFTPWEPFLLMRVSLYLDNDPPQTDALNVTIQSDASGSPSGTVLAWSELVYTSQDWRAFPITPSLPLAQGTTYWIVASNGQGPNAGYDMQHSAGDVVPGEAKRDLGSGWTPIAQDLSYQTFGLRLEPYIVFQFVGDRQRVAPTEIETFTVYLNNVGSRSPKGVWVNVTMPAALTYDADTSASLGGTRNGTSWFFPSLGNGGHSFSIAATVGTSVNRYLNTTARLDWTDSSGVRQLPQSASVSIETTEVTASNPGPEPLAWLVWLVAVLLGLLVVTAILGFRSARRPRIEEVFVIHTSGVLLYHLGRSMKAAEDKDSDVLGSMFTVIQDFVRESFHYAENRQLNKLEFGDYKILIERGPNLYLAIASSADVGHLATLARHAVDEIEAKYGAELASFSGRMEGILGIRDLVKKHLRLS